MVWVLRVMLVASALVAAVRSEATTVLPPRFGQMVNGSDYIVHARVKSVDAEKRAGARGAKIFTRVELEVIEIIAGKPPEKILLRFLGGRVGAEEMVVVGMPRFRVGDEDILFVSGNGRAMCPLYAMMHGRYRIVQTAGGERIVARSDGAPLRATAEISLPIPHAQHGIPMRLASAGGALSPAEFIREIRAAVTPEAKLLRAH